MRAWVRTRVVQDSIGHARLRGDAASVEIKVAPNGPLLMSGPLEIKTPDGQTHSVGEGEKAALCRCGQSGKKPFCDGTHKSCGFKDD